MEVSREEAVFFQGSTLNAHELELIGELEAAMGVFADENSMRLIGQVDDYSVAFNLYGRYIRPVVRFCKAIPAFKALDQEDMLVVLKPFYAEIISVRTAFLYDRSLDGFRILVNDWERVVAFVPMDCYRGCRLFDIETYCRNFLGLMNGAMEGDPVLRNLVKVEERIILDFKNNFILDSRPEPFSPARDHQSRRFHSGAASRLLSTDSPLPDGKVP